MREFRSSNRKRAAAAVAVYGAVLTAVLAVVTKPVFAVVAAGLTAIVAWRNARSGLFITDNAVVARNVGHSWRVALGDVAEISLMSTATDASRRTHVWVISADGNCHQVTSLHGNPLRGEALVSEIRGAVAEARRQSARSISK
ncbi:MAG TPA: hypothetical protein VG650_06405 [Mycobacteriales bacterium]|nr:hypothetical protein [Mycobacteriales bacterium]